MEVILNGVNGLSVLLLAEVVSNGVHELVPTRNQRIKPVRNSTLGLLIRRKHVTLSLAVGFSLSY